MGHWIFELIHGSFIVICVSGIVIRGKSRSRHHWFINVIPTRVSSQFRYLAEHTRTNTSIYQLQRWHYQLVYAIFNASFKDQYYSSSVSSITFKVNDSFMKSASQTWWHNSSQAVTAKGNELASWNDSLFEMFEK